MPELPDFVEINEESADWVQQASRADYEPLDEEAMGEWAAGVIECVRKQEKIKLLEPGLVVHFTFEAKESVRSAIEEAYDLADPEEAPHNLYDSKRESNCSAYDEYISFALRRESIEDPWRLTKEFDLKTLFRLLEPYSEGVKVVSLARPLLGYE